MDNPQTAIMQKLMLYVFPIGVVVGAPFLPLAILIYWVSNNLWTLGQQYVVYRRIDAEQAEKKEQAAATRQALAPRPGQKPVRPEAEAEPAEPPGEEARREARHAQQARLAEHLDELVAEHLDQRVDERRCEHQRHGEERQQRHGRSGHPQHREHPGRAAPPEAPLIRQTTRGRPRRRPPRRHGPPHHRRRRRIVPKTAQEGPAGGEDQLVREGDIAGDYLERLLDLLDYDGDIDLDVEAGRAIVSIDGGEDLDKLVGDRGAVLEALQELTRLAVQQSSGNRSRLMLDIAGWRQARRDELTEQGLRTAKEVLETGESVRHAADDAVRAQGRARRRRARQGRVERERGRGAAAPGRHLPRCVGFGDPRDTAAPLR